MNRLIVLQHLEREGPGLFIQIAKQRGFSVSIVRLDLGDSLPEITKGDVLLILGGPMGIRDIGNQYYPWLIKEFDLIKIALIKKVGIIGVCLGAQLLAHAAGGDVEVLQGGSPLRPLAEIGWHSISSQITDKSNQLITLLEKPTPVLHWHGDRILLPESAELIASSRRCKEQLFKIGSIAYGLQFHIEIDDNMIGRWIEEDKQFISSALGETAQSILKKQQLKYGKKTLSIRLELLNKLFDQVS